ncbi:Hsp20 family protein [bacterium]|nr:Hsp20 family protein [bacterium]
MLPENLDFDSIKANLENNLLVITIQKLSFTSQSIKIDRVEM